MLTNKFHSTSESLIRTVTEQTTTPVLLVGHDGFGKRHLALHIANNIVASHPEHIHVIEPAASGSISIDQIRTVKDFLRLKGFDQSQRRAIVMIDVETMTTEAQNASLKFLEEQPEGVQFILTAAHPERLLPTIISRVQLWRLVSPAVGEIEEMFTANSYPVLEVQKALRMSGGLIGRTHTILSGGAQDFVASVEAVKTFLSLSTDKRLAQVATLKDRQAILSFVQMLQRVSAITLPLVAEKSRQQWAHRLRVSNSALVSLQQNAQLKLVLTDLALSL